ncbi:MAG: DUF1573 domain-containing protein [Cytophagales bacterium]|nr:DUF1573 domain-containing protein [Cytophagales bacterium]
MITGLVVFSSCTGDLEERVRDLEGRVVALETQLKVEGVSAANRPTASATPQAKAAEPEVKPDGPIPAFAFENEDHDFGTINDGDIVEKVFKFTNTGDAPLIISNATATCGCTVPKWPKEPIAVGETGEIQVRFNSRNKVGIQNKTVTITANTYPSANKLRIKANVLKAEGDSK